MNTNAEEGPADAEHVAQDATSNNVEDRERRGILIAPFIVYCAASCFGRSRRPRGAGQPCQGINRVRVFDQISKTSQVFLKVGVAKQTTTFYQ